LPSDQIGIINIVLCCGGLLFYNVARAFFIGQTAQTGEIGVRTIPSLLINNTVMHVIITIKIIHPDRFKRPTPTTM